MRKNALILIVMSTFFVAKAQNPLLIAVSNNSYIATDSLLPFWFVTNQHGKVDVNNSFVNITGLAIEQNKTLKKKHDPIIKWGSEILAAFGEKPYYQINRAFAGFQYKNWELKGGLFYDENFYEGLSTSNGNIVASHNARPFPRISFSTAGFKLLPFWQNWLSFKAKYEEGILNDKRYVTGTHLHHKYLYFRFLTNSDWYFHIGFEHYAMWGGKSKDEKIGQLPEGFKAYIRYIFALPGNTDFPATDQKNISGNQLGTYQLGAEKVFPAFQLKLYLSHPWEDNTGLNWHNWPDNLIGAHFKIKKEKNLISDILYEFTNTRQQSVRDSLYFFSKKQGKWKMHEYDNYFNSGIYKSGYTYRQKVIGSPLFYPVDINDGISNGIISNRFFAHHFGLKGNLPGNINWKTLITYVQHYGTYGKPYTQTQKQFSALLGFIYNNPRFPFELGITAGADADAGNQTGKNLGLQFSVKKEWH